MASRALIRSPATISRTKSDARAKAFLATSAEDEALRGRVREVLAAADGWAGDETRFATVMRELTALGRDASVMQSRMIEAGRRLLRLQEAAGEGGYKALLREGLVPFSEAAASKLRAVAAAVEQGRLPVERLPRGLDPAYAAARAPEDRIPRLIEAGVIRPEATTREIRDALRLPAPGGVDDGPLTPGQRRLLERRAARLREELARIEARLGRP